jgi:hypothetical protein
MRIPAEPQAEDDHAGHVGEEDREVEGADAQWMAR